MCQMCFSEIIPESRAVVNACAGVTLNPGGADTSLGGGVGWVQTARTFRGVVAHPTKMTLSAEMERSVRMERLYFRSAVVSTGVWIR